MTALFSLNTLVLIGIVASAFVAVKLENILSSVLALAACGAFVSLEFIMLHAPDVAISEAAVGAVLGTVLFLIAIRKTTKKEDEEK